MASLGLSHGAPMTFEEHVEGYSNKEELKQYRRLMQISDIMHDGKTNEATLCMIEEFQSVDNAVDLLWKLKEKIFEGWIPI